jgi:hypothetical protein
MRRLVWLALLAGAAGCGRAYTSHDVQLSLTVDPMVAAADVASVRTLDVSVTDGFTGFKTYTLDHPPDKVERLVVHFDADKGHVTISVLARDGAGNVVLRGTTSDINLQLGYGAHSAAVQLHAPANGTHVPSGITITPASFTLFTGQSLQLDSGAEAVTWMATDGASIDDAGVFQAPATAGSYHVTAKSKLYLTDKTTVTMTVLANGVALYAGGQSGQGTIDGTGAMARLNGPRGLAPDGSGGVWFTDGGNTLRRVDVATGTVTTLAGKVDSPDSIDGTGTGAGFTWPQGLVFDGTSTLYVADSGCPCIRKVDTKSGQTTTLAGKQYNGGTMDGTGPAAQFRWPSQLVLDQANGLLYVTDSNAQTIRSIEIATGKVVTIAGVPDMPGTTDGPAAMARFSNPYGLALAGTVLYVSDLDTRKLRRLDLVNKTVSTVASDAWTAGAITVDGAGRVILTSPLRTVDPASGAITTPMNPAKH